jgi:MmeI, DNA-methyltransferase domain/MmeI, helicase spacer domain/MmeI, N-terminal domain/MmeI, target recognition domain
VNASEFINKWRRVELRERQAAQQHFLDLCALLGQDPPAKADPVGEWFCFERGASKEGGGDGWADVWKKGCFGWEYKGKHKDLDAAYGQLLEYRNALENPPLLVVCDMDRIVVHTNFTNTPSRVHEVRLEELDTPRAHEILHAVFFEPDKLKPGVTSRTVTEEAARRIGEIAQALREKGSAAEEVAHFLDRLVFCMFAEDVGLLPEKLFSRLVEKSRRDPARFGKLASDLFAVMADGGDFGADTIRRFNGNLFNNSAPVTLTEDEVERIYQAALLDWSAVEPSIFGTLFERGLDPDKRSQIGAHYTSREDIETLIEPVVMQPLRREWDEVRAMVESVLSTGKKHPPEPPLPRGEGRGEGTGRAPRKLSGPALAKAHAEADTLVRNFLDRLATVKVLDPACGSGNFLYVTLQKLLDLESEVLRFADERGVGSHFPRVDPRQLYGIEINPYAFDLAQMTVWIGYLQWTSQHGFPWPQDPVLKPSNTIRCMDAILDLSDPEHPKEPEWPVVDFIVSNPPFLGGNRIRDGLGDPYVDGLFRLYEGRVRPFSDLCCYWFEKARRDIETGKCKRAGLLGTQAIRGGTNRKVIEGIKDSGGIFFAVSDREWILDGANVHVSMIGLDDGRETARQLDGHEVTLINADLSASVDVTRASRLTENMALSFQGPSPKAEFAVDEVHALALLHTFGVNGRPTSDVVRPLMSATDITGYSRGLWTIDFALASLEDASQYTAPFEHVRKVVYPVRSRNRRASYSQKWWQYAEPRPGLRKALRGQTHFIVTPRHAKHRTFLRLGAVVLANDATIVTARCDSFFFGLLQSRVHELWARREGTQLRERESGFRYTPTTCFETFPFPWPPGQESAGDARVEAIAAAANELDRLRTNWLNPPEWTREEVLEFPGSADGPWARYVHDPDPRGIGTVRYPRIVPKDAECAAKLKARTLTSLYNQRPTWLTLAHEKLDVAVFAAYGWDPSMSDDHLLESLLALNIYRATSGPMAG